jgi:hypothetical protein
MLNRVGASKLEQELPRSTTFAAHVVRRSCARRLLTANINNDESVEGNTFKRSRDGDESTTARSDISISGRCMSLRISAMCRGSVFFTPHQIARMYPTRALLVR